ncbi:hypothetical protein PC116_g15883 [Phytophthora cactorum]|uniref:Uncharacterized protein n=2 Tax=Phytophthora cactorum TaxID=29920 RepID=A0A8T1KNE4_9STRA|nr:hypothetical protein Pcac1_g5766 [Phytophthora cactorum]KAG2939359.1 hypothetical protein PC117_g10967 [Phytophthora cactorum]KAG3182410.1 hypothetical protein PC128_g14697 [Phytophthora cactorum]KAG4236011.1 hypothetical protein PC116_g15883 [Phytophthora cactorum]
MSHVDVAKAVSRVPALSTVEAICTASKVLEPPHSGAVELLVSLLPLSAAAARGDYVAGVVGVGVEASALWASFGDGVELGEIMLGLSHEYLAV